METSRQIAGEKELPEPDYKLIKMLKAVELNMLKECICICEKHHIRYYLLGGSALGAVRHSGFIPWDDDIDIGMPRPDYDKFISVGQADLSTDYFLQTHKTDPCYPLAFAKIRDSNTTFIQPNVSHLSMNHGVSIDIFPLDGFLSNRFLGKIYYLLFNMYRATILYKLGVNQKSFLIHILVSTYALFFILSRLREKIEKLMTMYDFNKSEFVINWGGTWGLKEVVPKDFFGEGRKMKFEDTNAIVLKNYDGYLNSLYGDYMTPPPIEKRVSHHSIDVIDLDNSYTKYLGKK